MSERIQNLPPPVRGTIYENMVPVPVNNNNEVIIELGEFMPTLDTDGDYMPDAVDKNEDGVPDSVMVGGDKVPAPVGYIPVDENGMPTNDPDQFVTVSEPVITTMEMLMNEYNTTFIDRADGFAYQWGGVQIERAWIEWSPRDYMNLRFGKFFTPFGIWNVDHGLPILISPRAPYLLTYIPRTQTGLQLHGTAYLPVTDVNYSAYISNGRGLEHAFDDNNREKSFGGRLKLNFQSPFFYELSLGGSFYYGKHTEQHTFLKMEYEVVEGDDAVTVSNPLTPTLSTVTRDYIEFAEYLGGLDTRMAFRDFNFQAEVLWRSFDYRLFDEAYLENSNLFPLYPPVKVPNIVSYYLQLYYQIPLNTGLMRLRPFFRYEFTDGVIGATQPMLGTPSSLHIHSFEGGLNAKLNPFVVAKLDYARTRFVGYDEFGVYTFSVAISL
ncbi:MAG: hypothetical protein GF344_05750 [Chitinivibrionales bacterium]|nr:hypothetical protein [Chitinivibrionales bacterium]MBD3356471.1 hypothetical protein [Chitinivibrionales bacterium]